jgi:hypothetical protein
MLALRDLIDGVRIDSAYLPAVVLSDPFAPGPPNPIMAVLRPQVTIYPAGAFSPVVVAPYGEPGPSRWPMVRAGLIVGGVALFALLFIRQRKR